MVPGSGTAGAEPPTALPPPPCDSEGAPPSVAMFSTLFPIGAIVAGADAAALSATPPELIGGDAKLRELVERHALRRALLHPLAQVEDGHVERADALCFGSLAQRNRQARQTIQTLAAETSSTCIRVFDVNLRAPFYSAEVLQESLELATLEWVSWFNHHRLLEPIGYIPPAEAEENYYRQLASQTAIPV